MMVGTVEPRKSHALVLAAFEQLWQTGCEAQLLIVGKQGWMVEDLAARLRQHPEAGRRLHWLEGISDEYLTALYELSTALVVASTGEGFGLPLIEAARHGIPILARDIPVFREIAGSHAAYFDAGCDAAALATTIEGWLANYRQGTHPRSAGMLWLTWAQSAEAMKTILLGETSPYHRWLPTPVLRYWGNDQRLHTQVGRRRGFAMETTGQEGFLFYGPYRSLRAGHYRLELSGTARHWTGAEVFDISHGGGSQILLKAPLLADKGPWTAHYEFELTQAVNNLEFRLWVSAMSELSISAIQIESALA
jgi:hypothetical protein